MAKYDPLIEHLRKTQHDQLVLWFDDIERIIGERLPPSAKSQAAWWANSTTRDSHTWAHAWQAAGWKAKVKFADGSVTFTRFVPAPLLDALLPRGRRTVMDLVDEAGISVDDWKYSGGALLAKPQSNPAFCYDWSFGNEKQGFVLCVWHAELKEEHGRVVFPCDIGTHTRRLQAELQRPNLTGQQRSRLNQQLERSEAFERIVCDAYDAGRPLQLILNVGDMREYDALAEQAATVSERQLDGAKWYVHSVANGDAIIVRGIPRADLVEHEDINDHPPADPGEDDVWREGQIRRRRGQPEFRKRLLSAYGSRCTVTGTAMPDLLEAAHIIPHSEGTDYRESNGLLLRADIHTLFDLHHLSIDDHYVIHLSREAQSKAEYAKLHKTKIRDPLKPSQSPAPSSLASRHARFLAREVERLRNA